MELRHGVMVALQILVLSVQVRILVSQQNGVKLMNKHLKEIHTWYLMNTKKITLHI